MKRVYANEKWCIGFHLCEYNCSFANFEQSDMVNALKDNSYMQGFCAGRNMADCENVFDNAKPMNSIGFFGLHTMTAGSYFTEKEDRKVYKEKCENNIKRLYMKDGVLTEYIIISDVNRTGIYTSLIREKTSLDTINMDILKKIRHLQYFLRKSVEKNSEV